MWWAMEGIAMAALEIRLFGTLSLEQIGYPEARFPSRRVRDLMSYLLITRETRHHREHLAGLFWGDQEEQKARHCLNTALWRLRRVLGPPPAWSAPYLHVDTQFLGFNAFSDVRIDIVEFEEHCRLAEQVGQHAPAQQAALYREAVQYYRGDLLTDCSEDWCLVERERLRRLYMRALSRLMGWHMAQGDFASVVEFGMAVLAHDSLREEVQRDVIAALLASGRASAALEQYQSCERVLKRELGIAPMEETQALLPTILAHMHAAPQAVRVPLLMTDIIASVEATVSLDRALGQVRDSLAAFDRAREQLQQALDAFESLSGQALVVLPDSPLRLVEAG